MTDAEERAALAVVRSLGAAGYRVVVTSHDPRPLAGVSRFTARCVHVPDPLARPDEYARAISDLCSREGAVALIPVTEASVLAVLDRRDMIPARTLLPGPGIDAFRRLSDKRLLLETARAMGIAVPAQQVVELAGLTESLGRDLKYPVVIKPARSVGAANGIRKKLGVEYASGPDELQRKLEALSDAAFPVLLQERIVGPGVGVFLLMWDGTIRAEFAHRRIREKPPSGGVSVYRESVALHDGLREASRRLLEAFSWQGVAMVEYKVDAVSGTPYLMEVNGRFWGSLQLAIDAGVDFPVALLECAAGKQHISGPYRCGVRSRWFWGDVDSLLLRLRGTSNLPPDAPSLARTAFEFMRFWREGDRFEVLRLSDPKPFLRETFRWFWRR